MNSHTKNIACHTTNRSADFDKKFAFASTVITKSTEKCRQCLLFQSIDQSRTIY